MAEIELTDEEQRAVASLKRLAKRWPSSLWLFSASATLYVMKKNEDGERAVLGDPDYEFKGNPVDPDYIVDSIDGIDNDGGDW